MTKPVLLLCLVAACGKTSDPPATPVEKAVAKPAAAPAADPACAAKAKALEPWLAALELERKSYEVGTLPAIDRAPAPVPHKVDAVEVRKDGIYAWDVSEHDHARSGLPAHATQPQLVDFLTKTKAKAAGPDEFEAGPDDVLRIDVSGEAMWGDVVRVIDAATKAGYARAVFAFEATSKLEQPPGVEPYTKSEEAARQAGDRLEVLQQTCKPLGSVALRHQRDKDPAADAAARAKEIAAALVECNCAANPDELRALSWTDARWHQARPRVGVTLTLGGDAATTIALPAKTPWSQAFPKLVDAAPAVKLSARG